MSGESLLQQAFAETGVQLDRIIDAYKRLPPSPQYTKCYYEDGYEIEFDDTEINPVLVNDFFYDSSHGGDPIKIEFGRCVHTIQDSSFENYRSPPIFIFPKDGYSALDYNAFNSSENLDIYFPYNSISEIQSSPTSDPAYPWGIYENGTTTIHCSDGNITI